MQFLKAGPEKPLSGFLGFSCKIAIWKNGIQVNKIRDFDIPRKETRDFDNRGNEIWDLTFARMNLGFRTVPYGRKTTRQSAHSSYANSRNKIVCGRMPTVVKLSVSYAACR